MKTNFTVTVGAASKKKNATSSTTDHLDHVFLFKRVLGEDPTPLHLAVLQVYHQSHICATTLLKGRRNLDKSMETIRLLLCHGANVGQASSYHFGPVCRLDGNESLVGILKLSALDWAHGMRHLAQLKAVSIVEETMQTLLDWILQRLQDDDVKISRVIPQQWGQEIVPQSSGTNDAKDDVGHQIECRDDILSDRFNSIDQVEDREEQFHQPFQPTPRPYLSRPPIKRKTNSLLFGADTSELLDAVRNLLFSTSSEWDWQNGASLNSKSAFTIFCVIEEHGRALTSKQHEPELTGSSNTLSLSSSFGKVMDEISVPPPGNRVAVIRL